MNEALKTAEHELIVARADLDFWHTEWTDALKTYGLGHDYVWLARHSRTEAFLAVLKQVELVERIRDTIRVGDALNAHIVEKEARNGH